MILLKVFMHEQAIQEEKLQETLWSRPQRDYSDPNAGVCVCMQAMLEDRLWETDPDTSVITVILTVVSVRVHAVL